MKKEYEKENFETVVKISKNITDLLCRLGKRPVGSNFKTMKYYIELYEINTTHFETIQQRLSKQYLQSSFGAKEIELSKILVENSTFNRTHLKEKLYKFNLKNRICEFCGQTEEWKGKHMSLILDHINGVYNDNRLENLRILCPNCNATLDTHCGKNIKHKEKSIKLVKVKPTKIVWPCKEELEKLVWEKPTMQLALDLGVTDSAISKRCKSLGILKPPRGYWTKIYSNHK